jgi:tetratricopeptide (TPR) repeat protein
MRLVFPHIPRIISAVILWAAMTSLIGYNVVLAGAKPIAYSDKIFRVFTRPYSPPAHEAFAQALWDSGARALARQELAIVAELSHVLGAQTSVQDQREDAQIQYWQNAAATHPDYRDAYIQLAALSYARGNLIQAKVYLTQATALDPNGRTVSSLLEFISKLLSK